MSQRSSGVNILVHGASGRMGQKVLEIAPGMTGVKSALTLRRPDYREQGDVVVDFSLPSGFDAVLNFCQMRRIPLVSGTTGLSEGQRKSLKAAANQIPILWSANMSLGMHVFLKMVREFRWVADWNFKIEETHHVHKKDSPSGTALWLREELGAVVHKNLPEPLGIRHGEVIGDHEVRGTGPLEEIVLRHSATDRKVFAHGAVLGAVWIVGRPPGLYSLGDLVNTP